MGCLPLVGVVVWCLFSEGSAKNFGAIAWGATRPAGLVPADGDVTGPTPVSDVGECLRHSVTSGTNTIYVTCEGRVMVTGERVREMGRYHADAPSDGTIHSVDDLTSHNVVMAAMGECHFAVLTDEGRVFAWGCNSKGQLGLGDRVKTVLSPREVVSLSKLNVRLIDAHGKRSSAITDSGQMYLYGEGIGENGEVSPSNSNGRKPRLVRAFLNKNVCQGSLGSRHIAAVTREGNLFIWGDGTQGQLGLGNFDIQQEKPFSMGGKLRRNTCQVTAGEDFTVAVSQDSRVFLWGSRGFPKPFEKTWFQGRGRPIQVGAGQKHMAVLMADGDVITWGSKMKGQVGREMVPTFSLDPGSVEWSGHKGNFSQIAVGHEHTVALDSGVPFPSLCMCNKEAFSYWGNNVRFKPTCGANQNECNDGSCCEEGERCCRVSDDPSDFRGKRAVFEKNGNRSSFMCFPGKNSTCCAVGSKMACEKTFNKCNVDLKRCEPKTQSGATSESLGLNFRPVLKGTLAKAPGVSPELGSCGPRKLTCPDNSCCGHGSTCCPTNSGGYGCCGLKDATCCGNEKCCASGYTCNQVSSTCVKGAAKIQMEDVLSQCGKAKITCPDLSCCGKGKTCCNLGDEGNFGCCPFEDGVCCPDGGGCCQEGHQCEVFGALPSQCARTLPDGTVLRTPTQSTPPNTPSLHDQGTGMFSCDDGRKCNKPSTCCSSNEGDSRCCPFANATCCEKDGFCCPGGMTCGEDGQCTREGFSTIPQKVARLSRPETTPATSSSLQCPGETKCLDGSCCPEASMCCGVGDAMTCCPTRTAVCCEGGGCCDEGHQCDLTGQCMDPATMLTYPHFAAPASTPSAPREGRPRFAAPEKCPADQQTCENGLCCPITSTCVDKGMGEFGCCPQLNATSCSGGGCCPSRSTCDTEKKVCVIEDKDGNERKEAMLKSETASNPSEEYEATECFSDEQICIADEGCCFRDETCCTVPAGIGQSISTCCPHEDGMCCEGGAGCCPKNTFCNVKDGTCVNSKDEIVEEAASLRTSAFHLKEGLADVDCPDGSTCTASTTCCSLGYDEEWEEDVFGCCPYENAVCCADFDGCCPENHECDKESESCVAELDGEESPPGGLTLAHEPSDYVCEVPKTQCPNGKCCEAGEACVATSSGIPDLSNFKCVEKDYLPCADGKMACPKDLWCDGRGGALMCSEEQDNDPSMKKDLIRRFWGDKEPPTPARCAASCASSILLQLDSPEVKQNRAATQIWYPKKLVPTARPIHTTPTSLPTVSAGRVCQERPKHESKAVQFQSRCYISNVNGQFPPKHKKRVSTLLSEYMRRMCETQNCYAKGRGEYVFEAEELDPCPCRHPKPQAEVEAEVPAGTIEVDMERVSDAEALRDDVMPSGDDAVEPLAQLHGHKKTEAIPPEEVDSGVEYRAAGDVMWRAGAIQVQDSTVREDDRGGVEMQGSLRSEPFMGKEACADSVDLDGKNAARDDATDEAARAVDLSLAQMNAEVLTADSELMFNNEHK